MTRSDKPSALYLHIVQHPVSGDNYAGEDVRFSADFEALEAQLSSEQSMLASARVDWAKVREESERILRYRSRDLRVVCWLTWALYRCESFSGLLAGIGLLRDLCEHHWVALHPRKSRTRAAAFGWLLPRLDKILVEDVSVGKQHSLFQEISMHLEVLDELLGRYLGEEAPLMLPLRRRLTRMLQMASEHDSKPLAIAEQIKEVAAQFCSHPSIGNEKDARKALYTQLETAQSLCVWWLKQKATDLRALRLNRTMLWLTIEATPECNAQLITVLRGVPADKSRSYKERFEQAKHADLIVDIEQSIAHSPFWFDGQRLVWECLQALEADSAMREVEVQFALFLHRLPDVVELRFHDGLPFADETTKNWISTHVMPHVRVAQSDPAPASSVGKASWEAVLEEVIPTVARDGLKCAVQVLMQHLNDARNERERFFWQFSIARICYQAKKYELARIQLELLDQKLCKAGLEIWESETFLSVLRLLYSCYELLPSSQDLKLSKDALYRRLCQYDFETVLNKT
ncbi:type VI secretion system ImpA domain-containing protein [Pseudomonas floridensis]|uniref:Type VI secretion system ImpA domain-containing protein n=1 Tax=Pseudomonas floridensis TaxID=1958950 RepID=A0A1X0MGM6_9PSED|nr:type VI secretion system protein TssA [Pseudomonas floridensis]ORC45953.1 type VI secretion system ImpA domain-containing protein [Pseudomonas floridensis]